MIPPLWLEDPNFRGSNQTDFHFRSLASHINILRMTYQYQVTSILPIWLLVSTWKICSSMETIIIGKMKTGTSFKRPTRSSLVTYPWYIYIIIFSCEMVKSQFLMANINLFPFLNFNLSSFALPKQVPASIRRSFALRTFRDFLRTVRHHHDMKNWIWVKTALLQKQTIFPRKKTWGQMNRVAKSYQISWYTTTFLQFFCSFRDFLDFRDIFFWFLEDVWFLKRTSLSY